MTISTTVRLRTRITTVGFGPTTPSFSGKYRMLTPTQIVEEYEDLRRAGTTVWVEAFRGDERVGYWDIAEMAEVR